MSEHVCTSKSDLDYKWTDCSDPGGNWEKEKIYKHYLLSFLVRTPPAVYRLDLPPQARKM